MTAGRMLCAAIDIGTNTTRLLVAEPLDGQLRTVMQQRAYTRIGRSQGKDGIPPEKVAQVGDVVATQVRLARELGAEALRCVATAAIREACNRDAVIRAIEKRARIRVEILDEHEEARLSFVGATKTLGHPIDGDVAVADVGGGSSEVAVGTVADGMRWSRSLPTGSGVLADLYLASDPPSAAELRALREGIAAELADLTVPPAPQAVAVGGSATALRQVVGSLLEYETLERAMRVLAGAPIAEVARRFELDPQRVKVLPAGVLLLEKLSEIIGQPLQVGKGGLREGVVLELLSEGTPSRRIAAA